MNEKWHDHALEGAEKLKTLGVEFGDIRIVQRHRQWLQVKNGSVNMASDTLDTGFTVRALVGGAWGYAGAQTITPENIEIASRRAIEIASATKSAMTDPVKLAEVPPQKGHYSTPMEKDPFKVSVDEKLNLLFSATDKLHETGGKSLAATSGSLITHRNNTWLANTEGTDIHQNITICGSGITATATKDGEFQRRSYPLGHEGNIMQGGWEKILGLDLPGKAPEVAEEAVALLSADPVPAGEKALILDGPQMCLQIHESCGHPVELDRALGEEISLAGGSFLTPERLNNFEYGDERVNIYADSTTPGGPGTFGWDDEGVPAGRWDIIKKGQFVGYLPSRETAGRLNLPTSGGAMRAESWSALPIVRMININLEPGTGTLDDIIADTDDGILMSVNKSWSIDHLRLNFQFGCEAAWEIKGGKKTRLLKNPVYQGITPKFWSGCDAIAGESDWKVWGLLFCGKGDPMQAMYVGHGCSPARFQNVQVGAGS